MSLINSQEKQPALLDQVHDLHIAMEPGLGGQEKRYNVQAIGVDPWSQWSLAVAARKRDIEGIRTKDVTASQWSLAVAARKSSNGMAETHPVRPVAMEPGRGGQEKPRGSS